MGNYTVMVENPKYVNNQNFFIINTIDTASFSYLYEIINDLIEINNINELEAFKQTIDKALFPEQNKDGIITKTNITAAAQVFNDKCSTESFLINQIYDARAKEISSRTKANNRFNFLWVWRHLQTDSAKFCFIYLCQAIKVQLFPTLVCAFERLPTFDFWYWFDSKQDIKDEERVILMEVAKAIDYNRINKKEELAMELNFSERMAHEAVLSVKLNDLFASIDPVPQQQ